MVGHFMFLPVVQTHGKRARSTQSCNFNFFWFGDVKSDTHIGRYETSSDDQDTNKTYSDIVGMKDWQELVVKWDEFLHCVYHVYHWQMDCD